MGSSWELQPRQSWRLRLGRGTRRSQHPLLFILVSSCALCIDVSLCKASPGLLVGCSVGTGKGGGADVAAVPWLTPPGCPEQGERGGSVL